MLRRFYKYPATAILLIIFLGIGGIAQFLSLPIALYPKTSKPTVYLKFRPGTMSPHEFLERYGEDIEKRLSNLTAVETVNGRYRTGEARYEIIFQWSVDPDEAIADVRGLADSYQSQFPDYWRKPGIWSSDKHNSHFYASVKTAHPDKAAFEETLKNTVLPSLASLSGIEDSWVANKGRAFVYIRLNHQALLQYGLSFNEVSAAIKRVEFDKSLGSIKLEQGDTYRIQGRLKPKTLADLAKVVVKTSTSAPIFLDQVANIEIVRQPSGRIYLSQGVPLLTVGGTAKPDANLNQTATNFFEELNGLVKTIDPAAEVRPIMNPSKFINAAVRNVLLAVFAGMFIATLVVLVFLRSAASTLIICISIPLSLIGGLIMMSMFQLEINLISLGAMALAVGMVVDGSIVMLENIDRHLTTHPDTPTLDLILNAVKEVRSPVIASVLTTVIVFAPLPFTSQITSAILGDLAIVMTCVLTFSLVVTIVLIPPLVLMLRKKSPRKHPQVSLAINTYIGLLKRILSNRNWSLSVLTIAFIMLIAAFYVMTTQLKRSIMGKPETDLLLLVVYLDENQTSMEERIKIVSHYENKVRSRLGDRVSYTMSEVREANSHFIWTFVKDKSLLAEVKDVLESEFTETALVGFSVSDWAPTSLNVPNPPDLHLNIKEPNEAALRQLLQQVKGTLRETELFGHIDVRPKADLENYLNIEFNERQSSMTKFEGKSIKTDQILDIVSSRLREQTMFDMRINDQDHEVRLTLPDAHKHSMVDLGNFLLNISGTVVPLRSIAQIKRSQEFREYTSEGGEKVAFIKAWLKSKETIKPQELQQRTLEALKSNPEINMSQISFADAQKEINDNISSLITALIIAAMLITLLICFQFGSFVQTLVVLSAIPLGFVGVSFSLWIFDNPVNLNSMLGLILLCGTAVNNSIIFVDFFNKLPATIPVQERIIQTAQLRFRPIMITTLTTVLGMLPIATGWGSGGKILQPLGIAICGGLWVSTFLMLFVVPLGLSYSTKHQRV